MKIYKAVNQKKATEIKYVRDTIVHPGNSRELTVYVAYSRRRSGTLQSPSRGFCFRRPFGRVTIRFSCQRCRRRPAGRLHQPRHAAAESDHQSFTLRRARRTTRGALLSLSLAVHLSIPILLQSAAAARRWRLAKNNYTSAPGPTRAGDAKTAAPGSRCIRGTTMIESYSDRASVEMRLKSEKTNNMELIWPGAVWSPAILLPCDKDGPVRPGISTPSDDTL